MTNLTNLTRFEPFGSMSFDPFRTMDDFFYLKAELPGVKKEDIHVGIDGNELSINAEMRKEKEEKEGTTVLRSERYFGRWSRSFTLGASVDEAKAEAKYSDGILMLTLPKKGGVQPKEIAVN